MVKEELKSFWNWLWKSESIWSYIVFLAILFIIIKFVFLPGLGLLFGTQLPLAIVESSSMDHNSLFDTNGYYICGKQFSEQKFFNKDNYWNTCGKWYEQKNITKEQFDSFKFSNGFRKGDIIVLFGRITPKIGDVLIFQSGQPTPIIHRVTSLNPLQTKGDHNSEQIGVIQDPRGIDETKINSNQIIGVAVAKIPYLGWIKLSLFEHPAISGVVIFIIILILIFYPKKDEAN